MTAFSVCREFGIGFASGGKLDLPCGGWSLHCSGSPAGGSLVGSDQALLAVAQHLKDRHP